MHSEAAALTHMARAQQLAANGLYTCMPNPRVGCVLVQDDQIIGEGWHQYAGQAHAEVNALLDAQTRGNSTDNAAAFVTLEPCCHRGKTGPCTQQLIAAGIKKVFYGMEDPNPLVAGQGLQQLRDAGIETLGPMLEAGAQELNPGFIKRMRTGLPLVRVKMAMSVDGRTAMASGESKWITERAARSDVQRWRARSCAVVTGIESVMRDDALLNVRAEELDLSDAKTIAQRQPLRVILDSNKRITEDRRILLPPGRVLLVSTDATAHAVEREFLQQTHIECIQLPAHHQRINLRALLHELGKRQCNEILVEAGATLAGEFVQQGLVDEFIIYMAPKLLGSKARPLFELPLDTMSAQLGLTIKDIRAVGSDWRIIAKPDAET